MKKVLLIAAAFAFLFASTLVFSAFDSKYTSWEVTKKETKGSKEVMWLKFRINIPLVKSYLKQRIKETEAYLKTEKNDAKLAMLQRNWTNYTYNLGRMDLGKKLLNVWVFGDFNNWQTAVSDIPNALIPSDKNADTWYTKVLVPIEKGPAKKRYRYKFILNYGKMKATDGSEQFDYVYVEDPLSYDCKGDDGFGGFNSYFIYSK